MVCLNTIPECKNSINHHAVSLDPFNLKLQYTVQSLEFQIRLHCFTEFKDAWLMFCNIASGIQLIYVIDIAQETVTEF